MQREGRRNEKKTKKSKTDLSLLREEGVVGGEWEDRA